MGREGYELEITPAGVRITGGGEAGLLYGVQTLRQILRQEGLVLPCLPPDRPASPCHPGSILRRHPGPHSHHGVPERSGGSVQLLQAQSAALVHRTHLPL
ncbi:MAG: glycoside hydrolase family 20 zincin-like fold domain-containing protein [Oscillospiraceae bacterium]